MFEIRNNKIYFESHESDLPLCNSDIEKTIVSGDTFNVILHSGKSHEADKFISIPIPYSNEPPLNEHQLALIQSMKYDIKIIAKSAGKNDKSYVATQTTKTNTVSHIKCDEIVTTPWAAVNRRDNHYIIEDVNNKLCKLLDACREDLIGKKVIDIGLVESGYCEIKVKNKTKQIFVRQANSRSDSNLLFVYCLESILADKHRLIQEIKDCIPILQTLKFADDLQPDVLDYVTSQADCIAERFREIANVYNHIPLEKLDRIKEASYSGEQCKIF